MPSANNSEITQSQFAFWGPSGSGKTWIMRSLAKALTQYNQQNNVTRYDPEFEYKLTDYKDSPILSIPPDVTSGTSAAYEEEWRFIRTPRPPYPQKGIGAHLHVIHLTDVQGRVSVEGNERRTNIAINRAQCILMALDYTLISTGVKSYQEYVQDVDNLFGYLQQRSDRYIAVCVTKVDQLNIRGRQDYFDVIDMFFGQVMLNRLLTYSHDTGAQLRAFGVSATGYTRTINQDANFDSGTGDIKDKNTWMPHNVEQPFFWLFEQLERQRIERAGNRFCQSLFHNRAKNYRAYPKPEA